MSQAKLNAAKELIQERHFQVARAVLKTIPNDPTAKRWLAKLDEIAPEELGDPFANIPPRKQVPPPRPVRYKYKTVTVTAAIWDNIDKKVDRKIHEMTADGWEFVNQSDRMNMGIWGQGGNGARILQFRRPISEGRW